MIVNEAGASVYSASKLAAEEISAVRRDLRSAVSSPGACRTAGGVVKIDPKDIAWASTSTYAQKRLDETLSGVVRTA
jgi:uncharacterized protein